MELLSNSELAAALLYDCAIELLFLVVTILVVDQWLKRLTQRQEALRWAKPHAALLLALKEDVAHLQTCANLDHGRHGATEGEFAAWIEFLHNDVLQLLQASGSRMSPELQEQLIHFEARLRLLRRELLAWSGRKGRRNPNFGHRLTEALRETYAEEAVDGTVPVGQTATTLGHAIMASAIAVEQLLEAELVKTGYRTV